VLLSLVIPTTSRRLPPTTEGTLSLKRPFVRPSPADLVVCPFCPSTPGTKVFSQVGSLTVHRDSAHQASGSARMKHSGMTSNPSELPSPGWHCKPCLDPDASQTKHKSSRPHQRATVQSRKKSQAVSVRASFEALEKCRVLNAVVEATGSVSSPRHDLRGTEPIDIAAAPPRRVSSRSWRASYQSARQGKFMVSRYCPPFISPRACSSSKSAPSDIPGCRSMKPPSTRMVAPVT
jgi:hypothetical protein